MFLKLRFMFTFTAHTQKPSGIFLDGGTGIDAEP